MQIITRDQWGFSGWLDNSPPAKVALSQRTEFFVHYEGGQHTTSTGVAAPRAIHAYHRGQGWAGIGYSYVITQDGTIYEGRGLDYQGAHCPDHNISGFGVQLHIGGDQQPTDAALAACVDLYDHLCRLTGRTLAKRGHRDGFATECPGPVLYPWVQAGMPRPNSAPTPPPKEPAVPTSPNEPGGWLLRAGTRDNTQVEASLAILYKYNFTNNQPAIPGRSLTEADVANLADFQRVAGLVAGQGLDWPTMQALQYYDRVSLHWANANPGGIRLDIAATQWALARLGLMGDWDWWGGVGTFGPRTTEAVNRFYDREKAILGKGDGKWGPLGFGLLAARTGVFTCTTPYATPQPQSLPSTAGRVASPVPGVGIGTFYGKRKAGLWRAKGYHTGDDYPGAEGASAVAVRSGTVTVRDDGALGCIAILSADNGRHYWYCHLQRGSRVTGRVSAGQVIGRVGHTGSGALGPHLHFEDNGSRTQWGTDRKPTW